MNQVKYSTKVNKFIPLILSLLIVGGFNSPVYGNNLDSLWEKVNTINGDLQTFQSKYRQWANSVRRVIRQIQTVDRDNKRLQQEIDYIEKHGRARIRHRPSNDR